ncbi:MAG: deoxyribose-phosphate aldolase [Planctomycetota bacterium]
MQLATAIDHTLLKPDATVAQITTLCQEALDYDFGAICVANVFLPLVRKLLRGPDGAARCKVVTVVGFPHGNVATETKVMDTIYCMAQHATDIDMVINIGALKSGRLDAVVGDISEVVVAAEGVPVKVILETALLTNDEIVTACRLAVAGGARYVKTSTGFAGGGATIEHVRLMRATVGVDVGVKASGGVRDTATARAMLAAGANRIGTSSGIAIVTGK